MAAIRAIRGVLAFPPELPRLRTWLALGGVVGPVLFVLSFTVAGLLRPGYSPIHQPVSDLGVGPNAWVVDGAGVLAWLLLTACVIAFLHSTDTVVDLRSRWLCAALLALPPLGFGVASVFTESPSTLAVHWLIGANLAFVGPVVAFAVTGVVLSRSDRRRHWTRYSVGASVATALLVGAMFWTFAPSTPIAPARLGGLMERVVIIEVLAWYAIGGWRLATRGD